MDLKVHTCFNVTRKLTGVDEKTTTTHLLTAIASSFNFPGCWYLALQNPLKKDDIKLLKANDKPLMVMGRMRKKMVLWAFLEEDITNNNPIIFNITNSNFYDSLNNKSFINIKTHPDKYDNAFQNNLDNKLTEDSKNYIENKALNLKNSASFYFVKNENSIESHKPCSITTEQHLVNNNENFSKKDYYFEKKTVEDDSNNAISECSNDNADLHGNYYLSLQDRIKTQISVLENLEVEISKVIKETAVEEEKLKELEVEDNVLENELSEIMLVDWPEQKNICEDQLQQAHKQLLLVTNEVKLQEKHLEVVKKKVDDFKSFIQEEEKEDDEIDVEIEKWNELFQKSLHTINCNIDLHQ